MGITTSLLARNFAWVLSGSFLVRLSRIFTTYALARQLSIDDYGLLSVIVTVTQILNVISISISKEKIIQCDEKELEHYCRSAWSLQFIIGFIIFLLQCFIGLLAGLIFSDFYVVFPIILTGFIHLLVPFTSIQLSLLQRNQNFEKFSKISNSVIVINNLLTAILCYCGLSIWSIPFAWVISIIFQSLFVYNSQIWFPCLSIDPKYWKIILSFGLRSSLVEILTRIRESVDYLFVGYFLGVDSLGLYYFAFNSGLGFTLSVARPLERTIYSNLCSNSKNGINISDLIKCIKLALIVIAPIIILQSFLAPFYVSLLFGNKWVDAGAVPLLILICISGITRLPSKSVSLAFRAVGKLNIDLYWHLFFTTLFVLGIFFSSQVSLLYVSLTVLILHLLLEPLFIVLGIKFLKGQNIV